MNSEKSSELTSFCLGMSDRNDMTAVEKKLRAENELAATTRLCKARALCPLIKILVYCPAPSGTIHHRMLDVDHQHVTSQSSSRFKLLFNW
jgi:hypothetical protein